MQTALTYRTNRDLFSNHYLEEHLPETEAWEAVSDAELEAARAEIRDLWEREKETAPKRNESQLERAFIRPMFEALGIPFEVEESTSRTQRRPDYGFFETDQAARDAFDRREEGGDFYENAVAVADAKRWGRALDTRGSGEHERDFENPSYQIHVYLQETPARWAVLTNGKKWRLYYAPTSHRLDSYYEIDLPTVLESGDLEAFKYFYLFFRHEAFLPDASGDSFLDDVYDQSNVFAQALGEDLQDNIYEAIKVLAEGFLQYPENDLDRGDLERIHDSSLIYLYRLIFVLYAESEGRDLLDTSNEIYEESYSLNTLKEEVATELDRTDPSYRAWQDDLWSRLEDLFELIDQGSESRGIPEDDLHVPAYNGGLFRTNPDADGSREAVFLASHRVGDAYLARVIDLLARSEDEAGTKTFVDYSSLGVRHLGSVYEGLLEYELNVADEDLSLDDGEYAPADEGDDVAVEVGDVYLTTDSGERKATGSYYTPEYVVEYIVEETLGPLVEDIREDLAGRSARGDRGFAAEFAERVFDLTVLDPAMGSGHFLTSAVDYLAREIIDAQEKQAAQQGVETIDEDHDINWARRKVAQRCIYGVDVNPLAVELAKVSLWLRTLAAEQPLAFLDHHLKAGNSLVGSDIEDVLDQGEDATAGDGQLTLQQSFDHTRQQALEHVMERFTDLLSIDNETLDDIKEMEEVYEEVREDDLYQHLLAMANVHTASEFGLDVPDNAEERMAEALRNDSWADIEDQDWFESAQAMAAEEGFFHWELEYPVAFYGDDGERLEDSGFDAVIGNPPYLAGREWSDDLRKARPLFKQKYSCMSDQYDLYALFMQLGVEIVKVSGRFGFITPNTWLNNSHYEVLREWLLDETEVRSIGDFRAVNVFPDATVLPIVFIAERKKSPEPGEFPIDIFQSPTDASREWSTTAAWELFDGTVFSLSTRANDFELLDKIDSNSSSVSAHCVSRFGVKVYQKGKGDPPQTGEEAENDVFRSEKEEDEDYYPYVRGRDVNSWHVDAGDRWLKYGPHLAEPRSLELFQDERILVRRIVGSRLILSPVSETIVADQLLHTVKPTSSEVNNAVVAALLRSRLTAYYFKKRFNRDEETFPEIRVSELDELPIKMIASGGSVEEKILISYRESLDSGLPPEQVYHRTVEEGLEVRESSSNLAPFLEHITSVMVDMSSSRHSLNLSLRDYLGNYTEGPNLPDVGLFQPTSSTVLDATTEEYEKLRVGDVRTERDGARVTVEATARYKPEEEGDFETDQWGYTETEYVEAFALADLTAEEATLVEAFVPVAVAEAGGFAGFRENATKTNSLVDRLKAITLPDPDDVADDLRRYVETKERADELDAKIEKTDRLIDEIVYDLYDLTEAEIEVVEAAVDGA
ncbi:Eco57I restriction-modification methylase domain-containing protein [Halarchaeum grantii]